MFDDGGARGNDGDGDGGDEGDEDDDDDDDDSSYPLLGLTSCQVTALNTLHTVFNLNIMITCHTLSCPSRRH